MRSGFVGSTVMAWTLVASGSPLVSCSQPPPPTRRKIPGRLPDVNDPTPTYTRDGIDGFAMVVSFRRTFRRYDSTPGQTWPAIGGDMRLAGKVALISGGARGGSIVNISSQLGLVGTDITSPMYPASKGAVRLLTKVTAIQYAKEGIRANSVHPGPIVTPMTEKRRADPATYQLMLSRIPLGRYGEPEEVAYAVLYLASDESAFVTGSELVIDGGWTAQ